MVGQRHAVDAVVALVRNERLAGVTVTRALAEFDHTDHTDHTDSTAGLRSSTSSPSAPTVSSSSPSRSGRHVLGAPLVIEIVDRSERIEALLPTLAALCESGALTVTEARVYVPASHLQVRDVMTPARVLARPEAPLAEALTALLDTNARLIPVIAPEGQVVGVVTMGHLLSQVDDALAAHLLAMQTAAAVREHILGHIAERRVEQYMRSPAITVRENLPLDAAARLLVTHAITRAPVIDSSGRLAGTLSEHALITALAAPLLAPDRSSHDLSATDAELRAVLQTSVDPGGGELLTAGALADHSVPCVSAAAPWSEVARAIEDMPESASARLALVVDNRGALAGVIEEHELLRRLAQAPSEGRWFALRRALAQATGRATELINAPPQRLLAADLAHQARAITQPDTPLALALAEMARAGEADYAVVVADDGAPAGVLWRSAALQALIGA